MVVCEELTLILAKDLSNFLQPLNNTERKNKILIIAKNP